MPTLLFDGRETRIDAARADAIWLAADQLEAATGFHLEPQGFCQGELCVPIPPSARARFVEAHGVVSVGPEPGSRLAGAEAPDFTLPDFDGVQHSLSQYRGKKVLIMTWASW